MKKNELEEIEGGFWAQAAGYLIGALVGAALTQDLDSLGAAWNKGFNDGYYQ